jgi:hypothetical protein
VARSSINLPHTRYGQKGQSCVDEDSVTADKMVMDEPAVAHMREPPQLTAGETRTNLLVDAAEQQLQECLSAAELHGIAAALSTVHGAIITPVDAETATQSSTVGGEASRSSAALDKATSQPPSPSTSCISAEHVVATEVASHGSEAEVAQALVEQDDEGRGHAKRRDQASVAHQQAARSSNDCPPKHVRMTVECIPADLLAHADTGASSGLAGSAPPDGHAADTTVATMQLDSTGAPQPPAPPGHAEGHPGAACCPCIRQRSFQAHVRRSRMA